jgi:hypothetical protein
MPEKKIARRNVAILMGQREYILSDTKKDPN